MRAPGATTAKVNILVAILIAGQPIGFLTGAMQTAALFAAALLANNDAEIAQKLEDFRRQQRDTVLDMTLPPVE